MTIPEAPLRVHEAGIVTVPHYVGDALSRLCDTARHLECSRIAEWMELSADQFAKEDQYATVARILRNHALCIRRGEHHV